MRQCNGCTKCCDGSFLSMKIFNDLVNKKNPCKFINNSKCSIYDDRPNVCKSFNCLWILNESIPEEMYPKNKEVILYKRYADNIKAIVMAEAGGSINEKDIDWFNEYCKNDGSVGVVVKEDRLGFVNANSQEIMLIKEKIESGLFL